MKGETVGWESRRVSSPLIERDAEDPEEFEINLSVKTIPIHGSEEARAIGIENLAKVRRSQGNGKAGRPPTMSRVKLLLLLLDEKDDNEEKNRENGFDSLTRRIRTMKFIFFAKVSWTIQMENTPR